MLLTIIIPPSKVRWMCLSSRLIIQAQGVYGIVFDFVLKEIQQQTTFVKDYHIMNKSTTKNLVFGNILTTIQAIGRTLPYTPKYIHYVYPLQQKKELPHK